MSNTNVTGMEALGVNIGSYESPERTTPEGSAQFRGWIEDERRTWILYVGTDGSAVFFPHRDATGGVVGEGISSRS